MVIAVSVACGGARDEGHPRVYFGEIAVDVEVADTKEVATKGLSNRDALAPDAGMLFVLPRVQDWQFHMKDTRIPLDIVFIDSDLTVVGVIADMKPLDESPRSIGVPSAYAVEVNAGWAARHAVARGARVRFAGVPLHSRDR
jgi:uncharacterized protein